MRISDWSSDVCSSDLGCAARGRREASPASFGGGARQPRPRPGDCPRGGGCPQGARGRRGRAARRAGQACCRGAGSPRGRGSRGARARDGDRSEEHTSELQSLMRISYAVFCLKKKKNKISTVVYNYTLITYQALAQQLLQ